MPLTKGLLVTLFTASVLSAQSVPCRQLTAREFHLGDAMPALKSEAPKPSDKAPVRPARTQPKPVEIARAEPRQAPPCQPTAAPPSASTPVPGAAAPIVKANTQTAPMPTTGAAPLSLRYAILKLGPSGSYNEVPDDTVFHPGDKIRFSIEPGAAGYLYIVNQGSDGTWAPMFPSPEIENGSPRVEARQHYNMPPNGRLSFDSVPGIENLFIVYSRHPEPDFEKMVSSLQGARRAVKPEEPVRSDKTLITAVNIGNFLIDRMRNANSRNLIVERIDPTTPGDTKETAVYVVNPSGSADSQIVVDLRLVHK